MIVLSATDPLLRAAMRRIARPDEQVVADPDRVGDALRFGYPRLYVVAGARAVDRVPREVAVLHLEEERLRAWEAERRRAEVPRPRLDDLCGRLRGVISTCAVTGTWVDGTLAELGRASGGALPLAFASFARHVLELPRQYTELGHLAETFDLTRGALKARFRRRNLESPFTYLRWCRTLAVAHVLSDPDVTVSGAADRLGFTSGGNMCRSVRGLTGVTPHRLRDPALRRVLVLAFASRHLTGRHLAAWRDLDDVFRPRRVA